MPSFGTAAGHDPVWTVGIDSKPAFVASGTSLPIRDALTTAALTTATVGASGSWSYTSAAGVDFIEVQGPTGAWAGPFASRERTLRADLTYRASDYATLAAAVAAAPAGATIALAPNTTYAVNGLQIGKSLTIVGAGRMSSIIDAGANTYGITYSGPGKHRVLIRDVGFTGSTSAQFSANGYEQELVELVDTRHTGFTGKALEVNGARVVMVRPDIAGDGTGGPGTALWAGYGAPSITVRDARFRWLFQGIYVTATGGACGDVDVTGCNIDGGWQYLKALTSRSGSGITYTATTLTDTSAAFPTYASLTTVRAMATKRAGTNAGTYATISDASASFISQGVQVGDLVRTSTAWAVVTEITSATALQVEEWLSLTDYQPVPPPGAVAYTVYGVVIGRVISNTATVLTVDGWRDMDGTVATPAAATRYEVCNKTDYQLFAISPRKVKVSGNTVKRAWSDGISLQAAKDFTVIGNTIERCQDVGITIEDVTSSGTSRNAVVMGNDVTKPGTAGIFLGDIDTASVTGNSVRDPNWITLTQPSYGAIEIADCADIAVTGNTGRKETNPQAVDFLRVTGVSARISFVGNRQTGFTYDLHIDAASATDIEGRFQPNAAVNLTFSAVGPRGEFSGTGVPALPASPGSTYRRTDGGASTSLYVKETASSSTTWRAV